MDKLIEVVALLVLCGLGCFSLHVLQVDSKEIVIAVCSGIVGYLTKSGQNAIVTRKVKKEKSS